MLAGVTIEQPETVTIDKQVTIGQDTIVGPFTQILGKTQIGAECLIGAGSILANATLGEGVEVLPYSYIEDSTLEASAHVGPFAKLRMNSVVETGAHVGNFVELKNSRLGAGSKAMHLAYLGDSTIGRKTNIGAAIQRWWLRWRSAPAHTWLPAASSRTQCPRTRWRSAARGRC
jgi:bifunctional UDP-N-acetylglucosamine pyrophosphorylase/glucosamine-1-phosphate N-acetyltransferase